MSYHHEIKLANSYAKEAMDRINKENLSPTPDIFELWYVYYAKLNTDLTRAIDVAMASNKKIDDQFCKDTYREILSNHEETETVKSAGNSLSFTIKEVLNIVKNIQSSTSEYNDTLAGATKTLEAAESEEEIEKSLKIIVAETGRILEENILLEEKLNQSTEVIEHLQKDIDEIRREATTDGLTGLMNRRSFDDALVSMVGDENSVFTLLMVDIDHFKSFNDNYGHQVGDQVLRLVARTLSECIKGKDIPARYGGEEFTIILPDTELKHGIIVAENLRRAVATKEVVNRNTGERLGRITMSVGIAEYQRGESPEDLLERSDAALYTAKHNGRNQVASAPSKKQSAE